MVKSASTRRLVFNFVRFLLLAAATVLFLRISHLATEQTRVADAINQAGMFRCAPQRLVKQELGNQRNENLRKAVSDMISALHSEQNDHLFPVISGDDYRDLVADLTVLWNRLDKDIDRFQKAPENRESEQVESMMDDSEAYFELSNALVDKVRIHSERLSRKIKVSLSLLFGILICLVVLSFGELLAVSRRTHELKSLAFRDGLTGLYNRYACDRYLSDLSGGFSHHIGTALFDLNNLKNVNDELGHEAGDRLIRRFAEVLDRFTSRDVFISRNGGDEFLLIVRKKTEMEFYRLLDAIQKAVTEENKKLSGEPPVFYAVGTAFGSGSIYGLVKEADSDMYRRKREMKNGTADGLC